ncbi:uncharacterized protein LOC112468940 [Temnothorax curvispinosus]|uniref:Uncharacterized protein LOC112468940 n=2 Tax=Temnothorax TaxID=300110 RepID=A0A6J1RII7_9HYME|nr:uncharacterized protein LOC112468940 [Temnothorax curvispinosus]XP_024894138.1 uncharacterized protein LOC112468940 [Temnothorax curvispinosus]
MESGYIIRGNERITAKEIPNSDAASECICYRPHSNIICNGCGFWTKGRVRYCCPQHPKIVFLHDHAQCPRCRSYDFMLTEI